MLHHLAARAFMMMGEGADLLEAILWVTRRIDRNLQMYYRGRIFALLATEVFTRG